MAYRLPLHPGDWWVPVSAEDNAALSDPGIAVWDTLERTPKRRLRPRPEGEDGWTWIGRVLLYRSLGISRWSLAEQIRLSVDVAHPAFRSPLERFFVGPPGGRGRALGRLLAAWPDEGRAASYGFGGLDLWLKAPAGVIAAAFAQVLRGMGTREAIARSWSAPWPQWLWQLPEAPRSLDGREEILTLSGLRLPPAMAWLEPAVFADLAVREEPIAGFVPVLSDGSFGRLRDIPGVWLVGLDLSWSDVAVTGAGRRLVRVNVLEGSVQMPYPYHEIRMDRFPHADRVAVARAWPAGWKYLIPMELPEALDGGLFHSAGRRAGSFVVAVALPAEPPEVVAMVVRRLLERRASGQRLGPLDVDTLAGMAVLYRLAGEGVA
ncbi:hypothetical protein [Thermaerobacter litoralis]